MDIILEMGIPGSLKIVSIIIIIIIISLVSYSEWYSTALLVIIIFNSLSHLQLLDCAGEDDEPLSTTAPIATNKPIITTLVISRFEQFTKILPTIQYKHVIT